MSRVWRSVAFRLALGYGILAVGSSLIVSAVVYFAVVGIFAHHIDANLRDLSSRLVSHYATLGPEAVRREVDQLLTDGIDQDTEVYELVGADGRQLAGNLAGWTPSPAEAGRFEDRGVIRYGRPSVSRLLSQLLPDGAILVVGRDLQDQFNIEQIVWRAARGRGAFRHPARALWRLDLSPRVGAPPRHRDTARPPTRSRPAT